MNRFLTFLGEAAFPPPKKKTSVPASKGSNSPFDVMDRAPHEKMNPGNTQQKAGDAAFKRVPDGDEPEIRTHRVEVGADEQDSPSFPPPQQPGVAQQLDPLAALQWQAEQEKEQQDTLMRRQKQREADAEANAIKQMRTHAEAEVAAALENRYNGDDDTVEFYPEILTFGQFTKDGKQDAGGKGQQPGSVGQAPGDRYPEHGGKDKESTLNTTAKKQDARQNEEDADSDETERARRRRQLDNERGDAAKTTNKQQKKW